MAGTELSVSDALPEEEGRLESILGESFDGWYLRHSRKTLREVEKVRVLRSEGTVVGLAMLKNLDDGVGYVYYLAVARAHRKKGFGGKLLDDALAFFASTGVTAVYASVENEEAMRLFESKGFRRTDFGEVSTRYGVFRAVSMYRSMLAVPGEVLLRVDLGLGSPRPSSDAQWRPS